MLHILYNTRVVGLICVYIDFTDSVSNIISIKYSFLPNFLGFNVTYIICIV